MLIRLSFSILRQGRSLWRWCFAMCIVLICMVFAVPMALSQYFNPVITRPASIATPQQSDSQNEINLPYPVQQTIPETYEDLLKDQMAIDLQTPSNITMVPEYDPQTGMYVIHSRLGDTDILTPFMLTQKQYDDWQLRRDMQEYYRQRNLELVQGKDKQPFDMFNMNFDLGPLEKVFGPGGVQLKTQGSVQLKMGIKSNKSDNPSLSVNSRRKTYFDFQSKIQASINASVGDALKFNMTYNTDATFDFDSKNIKLAYEGKEDDIVKTIEAGNVSMTTGSSLIRGATALFGIKSVLQFGKLTTTLLLSQQNSESQTVSSKRGVQATEFEINADEYDANRHYFLAHWFRENYDAFCSKLPYVSSGVQITRIEVWITNKGSNYNETRNFVAFMDLGENRVLANTYWKGNLSVPVPSNTSNNLLNVLKAEYPEARNISTVTQALAPLEAYGIMGGNEYEKVESARLLNSSEYTLNSALGYISLKTALNSDEVLGVAYEYTYGGQVYQVGEFSGDITTTSDNLYLKMIKGTTQNVYQPMWKLMMKNVYYLGANQIQKKNFKLNIKYLSDTTGIMISYLPVEGLNNQTLLQVMNLDRIDSNAESNPDGWFDFIEGYTMQSATGRLIFPVAEPFGSNLWRKINNPAIAEKYVYQELYDSTLTVARQFADKNKFVLKGEYQASAGSIIRLNATNVPRGSVLVYAGGVRLTENTDYTVDYTMGTVTITNQSIIDSGQNVSVSLENQALYSTQRKTLVGLDLQYQLTPELNIGATLLHFSEKALVEKVTIGDETVNNTMLGFNLAYNNRFMWLTNLLNKIPTVNAVQPSSLNLTAEYAKLIPHRQEAGSAKGSSYVDDFESTQTGIDLRSPYAWKLASTPFDPGADALFPEAALSNNVDYGKNRALLNWYYIDRMFTQRNSSLAPSYIKSDLEQLSNPYVREVTYQEIFPGRELSYGESSTIQTLNLSFYPTERGPYNLDADNIDTEGNLLYPDKRWGGIMRKMDNTDFESSNIEYIQFWMMNPFLDPNNPNYDGGDLYFNFGEISEDILKDGMKSYENGIPFDGDDSFLKETVWGRVSSQSSLTYAFDNATTARLVQDVGLDGLPNDMEFTFSSYQEYLEKLRARISATSLAAMQADPFSPFNDPAGDNYHFYRGYDYDEQRVGILDRYKRYNNVEGNSLSTKDAGEPLYQSSQTTPDVEDINQDNTLNEYERYFQYKVSIRPQDLVVGQNFIYDKQVSIVHTRDGKDTEVEWYQFKIPLQAYEKVVGSISDFSSIRFARMFMTGFKQVTHLRFATLELVRGEWRTYDFNLNSRGDAPAQGQLDVSVVNIEENASQEPVNYVLPPGVTRITDPSQSQIVQLNEQSMALRVSDLQAGDARAVYKNTGYDLRNYKRLQMWVHAEAFINDVTNLRSGELSLFIRLGSDVKNNYYEYEIPLMLTPPDKYSNDNVQDRYKVWPEENFLNLTLQHLVDLKKERNAARNQAGSSVSFTTLYTGRDPSNNRNTMAVLGNPSLSDVRVMLIGVRNNSSTTKDGTVWVNELKVTDFNEDGGWAAKVNATLGLSDLATMNFSTHIETSGFGGVDQSLNNRNLDDYSQYTFAIQADLGRFVPQAAKLRAPIYYSYSSEKINPKYNPLDQDVLLSDALDACANKHQRDSISAFAVESTVNQSFSLSGVRFDVKSKKPKPWDPANFSFNFSFSKQAKKDPTIEYENTNDYRGSFSYNYSPYFKPLKPFSFIDSKKANLKFLSDWELGYLPTNISFLTTISRYYYEQQMRSETDSNFQLPVSVSKNFLWDRQLSLSWNLTNNLSMNFNSNTSARIEETTGAVNRKLYAEEYEKWKDTVWSSIKSLGTPWSYNQTFSATYKMPFNKVAILDFITANASYNATYRWDRGATVDGQKLGNSIANQATFNFDGRINFESFYNKIPLLKDINTRFQNKGQPKNTSKRRSSSARDRNKDKDKDQGKPKAKRFERTFELKPDTTLVIKHNLRTKKVKVSAKTTDDQPFPVKFKVVDANNIEILTQGEGNYKFTVTEILKDQKPFIRNFGEYALRVVMSPRNLSVRYKNARSMSIPLFNPNIGDVFGQSTKYGPMAPGLDFAFGFAGEDYVNKALDRGWLITNDGQTTPATWTRGTEFSGELQLELFKGFKVTMNSTHADSRTNSVQFMFEDAPISRSGTFTMTNIAILTALRGSKAENGYYSPAFQQFAANIPIIRQRLESQYASLSYPDAGFIHGMPMAGTKYDPAVGRLSATSSDVLIPAFVSAYTKRSPHKTWLNPFPSLGAMLPNWKITYDGLINMGNMRNLFKTFTLSHAYTCTYSVGSYSSYLNWVSADGEMGFTLDALTGNPIPSSPYNITSVAITEKFAPLIGATVTLQNGVELKAEYRDQRTLTLNTAAGQIVEATSSGLVLGAGYKIVAFNTFLKMKGTQTGVSNDLTLKADINFSNNKALIRNFEQMYSQATSGTRSFTINFSANYVLSRAMTLSAYFDHQVNTPLVTTSSYPTANSSYGLSLTLNLAR